MSLKHADIWRAIDELAKLNGLSPSGLSIKAGLSPTLFNPSKRLHKDRKHWPSTESIAAILQATNTTLDEFVMLAAGKRVSPRALPLLALGQAGSKTAFDDAGHPAGRSWDEMSFAHIVDAHAFALEISGKGLLPVYRDGDRIIVSPAEKPRRGDRVVVRSVKGDLLVRQLGRESAQKIELLAFTPYQPVLNLSSREIEWIYRIVWASQ